MFPQLTYVFKKIYSFTNEGVILLNLVYNVLSYLAFTKVGDLISHHSYFVKSWLLRLVTTFLFLVVLLLGIKSKILAFCLLVGFLVSYSLSWSGFLNPVTSKLVERFGKIHKGYIDFFVNLGYFITSTFSGVVLSTYGFYANLLVALMLFTIGGMLIWKKIMLEL
jgi:predicted MFS family arabinose efflux permease